MSKRPFSSKRLLIWLVYLAPAIMGILLLVLALIPHLWFVYNEAIQETLSPVKLVNNTWEVCQNLLKGDSEDPYAVIFSYVMSFFVILFWIFVALYALFVAVTTVCVLCAFSGSPTTKRSNRAKRWMHLLCPNRVCYALFGLLPIFPSFFPYILTHFYYTRLGLKMHLFFYVLPDPVWVIGLVLLMEAGFLLTLKMQSREHLDMFRLYKRKPVQKAEEDESCSTEN